MSGTVAVRQATADDWQAYRSLRLDALRHDPDAFGSTLEREQAMTREDWLARLADDTGPSMIAGLDGAWVGLGGGWLYEPGRLMVVAMWTRPEARGHGVGAAVLAAVVEWAHERGLRPDLWVADDNPRARALYERFGFRADGTSAPLREGSLLTMSRLVLPDGPAVSPGQPLQPGRPS